MSVILIPIGLLSAVLLYEYFSNRKWQQVTSEVRNDIVFEKRNKQYGAYKIRKDYDKTMLFILGGLVFTLLSSFTVYKFSSNKKITDVITPKTDFDTTLLILNPDDKEILPELVKPLDDKPNGGQETVPNIEFLITDDDADSELLAQTQLEKEVVGDREQEGNGDPFDDGFGPGDGDDQLIGIEIEPKDNDSIFVFLTEDAEYIGGFDKMHEFISKNIVYPKISIDNGDEGIVYLSFVIEKDGQISNLGILRPVTEELNTEATRVVKKMPRWKAGRYNGRPVRQLISLPIKFELAK